MHVTQPYRDLRLWLVRSQPQAQQGRPDKIHVAFQRGAVETGGQGIVAALVYDLENDTTDEQKAVLSQVVADEDMADDLWDAISTDASRARLKDWIKHEINEHND